MVSQIKRFLDSFIPIGLDSMDDVRLMNRIDTKYVMLVTKIPDLLSKMDGGYKVLEINNERIFSYTTTYLDSCDYIFFNQHVTGKPERNKVRYRKYETTGTTFLEVKRRTNKNRTIKWRIENNLMSDRICDNVAVEFIKQYIPQSPLLLNPVLINRFKRVTLVGSEMNERITVDYDLSFSNPDGPRTDLPFIAIVEIKKAGFANNCTVAKILKDLYIRQTGFSKYCVGASILNTIPRKNIIKQKLLLINKMENEFNRNILS